MVAMGGYRAVEPDEWEQHPFSSFVDAIRKGRARDVEAMLRAGTVNSTSAPVTFLNPPIIEAVFSGQRKVVAPLIGTDASADLTALVAARDIEFGATPLHWAAAVGDEEVVRLLLHKGADVKAVSWEGFTPIHAAAAYGHAAVLHMMLTFGGDPKQATPLGVTPVHLAAEKGHFALVSILLEHGADPSALDGNRYSPLMRAAVANQHCTMLPLLNQGVDVHARDNVHGRTCLHWASHNGHLDIVDLLLLTSMVDIDSRDRRGDTALHLSSRRGHRPVVDTLLSKGAKKDAQNDAEVTPMLTAAFFGHAPVVEVLLKWGAKAGLTDAGGRAPLHWAAHNDADGVLRLLLVAPGVDRGAVDGQGLTALDLALQNEAEEAIAVLQGMES